VKRRIRMIVMVSLLAALLVAGAPPASANFSNGPDSAGIVERFESPGFGLWVDSDAGLIAFANVNSVADACNGIPAGAGDQQVVVLPNGVVLGLLHDDAVPIIVVPLGSPDDICAEPDNWQVIATGVGNVRSTDNDFNESGTRTNSFGSRLNGSVVDADGGKWSIAARFRARIDKGGNFTAKESVNLAPRG